VGKVEIKILFSEIGGLTHSLVYNVFHIDINLL